jgi:hypothetical protein
LHSRTTPFKGITKVRPLLTADRSEAEYEPISSTKQSLLFQIPSSRVLRGSYSWSKSALRSTRCVTDLRQAKRFGYYAEAFEIDWRRATPIKPKRYVRNEERLSQEAGENTGCQTYQPPLRKLEWSFPDR